MKRGTSLPAGKAKVSSVWSHACAACASRAVPPQEGAGAVGNPTCSKEARVPCSPGSCSRESREGWASGVWWEKGWTRASKLPVGIVGACPFLFLEIGARGENDFITSVSYPKEAFLGCSLGGAWSVSSYSAIWDTHKKTTFKMWISRGTAKQFFDSPHHLQSSPVHYYHSRATGQITVLGGAFGKWLCFPLSPLSVGEVESSYTCHFTLSSGFWSQGCFHA